MVKEREVKLSSLDKVLWPDPGIDKAQLLDYHIKLAPYSLKYWQNRPLTLTRYPKGVLETGFYQKNCPESAPDWVKRVLPVGKEAVTNDIVVDQLSTLIWWVNQSAIEFHPATYDLVHLSNPSFAIIDLDPTAPTGFLEAVQVATYTRVILDELGLRGYPKTSGGTGVHIYIPLEPIYTFAQTNRLIEFIGELLSRFYPMQVTQERLIKNRNGVYIDHMQNRANKTIVGVYSPRPLNNAPVSTPVTWDELGSIHPGDFTVSSIIDRINSVGDIFAPVLTDKQNIDHLIPLMTKQ